MKGKKLKFNYLFWGAIVIVTTIALLLTIFQPPSPYFAPPTENITKEKWLEVVARSRSEGSGQLFAIPYPYILIEDDWMFEKNRSHFFKSDLERSLKEYGLNLDELKTKLGSKLIDKGNIVEIDVSKTIHRYPYEYDINIPLIFYGPGYVIKGKFEKFITQQHIVPTLAVATGGPMPIGARGEPLREIFTRESKNRFPKVIVLVSIDMGGDQYFWAHPDATPNIDYLRNNGADFINTQVSHLDVETAPGHAAIGTGAYPANSNIYANNIWNVSKQEVKNVYTLDQDKNIVDPSDLKVPTFADDFDKAMKNKPIVISYSFAARASIGMAGHGSQTPGGDKDIVFWLSEESYTPTTNTQFYSELPEKITTLNSVRNFMKHYPSGHWMGHPVVNENGDYNKYYILSSPAQVKYDGDIILSTLESQQIGKDNVTDLVFVAFKSTDYAGHEFGWESIEARETFSETDNQIGRIKDWLEKNVPYEFILIITADHGAAPLSEFSNGARVNMNELMGDINKHFDPNEKRILLFPGGNWYMFDEGRLKELSITYDQVRDYFLNYTKDGKKIFDKVFILPEIEAEQKRLLKR